MKTAIAAFLLAFAAVTAAEEGAPPTRPPSPLQVPELVYDAGKIERGEHVRHTFVLNNVGAAELKIDAKPG